jgi:hypothetical protein
MWVSVKLWMAIKKLTKERSSRTLDLGYQSKWRGHGGNICVKCFTQTLQLSLALFEFAKKHLFSQ